ncbi:hypothetical protein P6U16_13885 [Rhizobium sp. 32-5/1]|uniref:hypothetical protein n=1 Tax=Rhizobium sp. 32-5/1 TaxID=3019602 RepID=UPI00240D2A4F|nr:hypothetical protein [Rhizobium sp. 32-5/1]WEZ82254.1 hypothetical protein P6U16_13885 [Rhizobium sp. 32-5/1]
MSLPSARSKRSFFNVWTVVACAFVAAVWYFGIGDRTPSRDDAERFLRWGFDHGQAISAIGDDGTIERLKTGKATTIDEIECHRKSRSKFFHRRSAFPKYDCIYRLLGVDGRRYRTVVSATYIHNEEWKMVHVGKYMLVFWDEPGQRQILAQHDVIPQ